jgi:hypothetical protein
MRDPGSRDLQWRMANRRRHASEASLTMVCYARPAFRMAALLLVVFLAFGRSAGHFLASTALIVGIATAVAVAAVAAAVAFTMFLSVRRRRAAAGGCVSCQLRCQHAMTEQPRRLLLVSTVDRGAAGGSRPSDGPAAPRWPDRPAIRSGAAGRPPRPVVAPRAASRERASSAVLPAFYLGFADGDRTLAGTCSRRSPANHATATVTRVRDPAAANTGRGSPPSSPAMAPARIAPISVTP